MMCLKTGFIFRDQDGRTWNGDLKTDGEQLVVTGVNKREYAYPDSADAELENVEFMNRGEDSPFRDTKWGVKVVKASDQFVFFMKTWNPDHLWVLP